MPRQLDPNFITALTSDSMCPIFAITITFASQTFNLWTGYGTLDYNGVIFQGTGDLGKIGSLSEGTTVEAKGTTITLSGINQAILQESITDVQIGAPVIVYFGAVAFGTTTPVGALNILFQGLVDKPQVTFGPEGDCSITINLESHLIRLSSGTQRHYTSADQRLRFPTDTIFMGVESLNDLSLKWGSS